MVLILSNNLGVHYIGNFRNGLRDGLGRIKFSNGDSYDGEWKDGMRCGNGKYAIVLKK